MSMGVPPSFGFSGVAVGLPSKVRGSEAEEEWQDVDWVTWSTGHLQVDSDCFLLVFKPARDNQVVKAKPLGNLVRASGVAQDEDSRTLVVATSDALRKLYRFTFATAASAAEFMKIAEAAEAQQTAAAAEGTRRAASSGSVDQGEEDQLVTGIEEHLRGRWPLVYGDVELFGPDPNAEEAVEVLLGRGAIVLLDPPDSDANVVGRYELLFYNQDDGPKKAAHSFVIGPKMALKRLEEEREAGEPDEPLLSFEFRESPLAPVHTFTFDDAAIMARFARDARVRKRFMALSQKTVVGQRSVQEARSELEELRRRGFFARLFRLLRFLVILFVVAAVGRFGHIWYLDQAKHPAEHASTLLKEGLEVVEGAREVAMFVGSKACELAVGAVSVADLKRCTDLGGVTKVQECVLRLLGGAA